MLENTDAIGKNFKSKSRSFVKAMHFSVVGMNYYPTHKALETKKFVASACVVIEISQVREKSRDLELISRSSLKVAHFVAAGMNSLTRKTL